MHTLGAAVFRVGRTSIGPGSARLFSTMLVLAAERGRNVSRELLGTMLFPGTTAFNANHSLRQLAYKLRGYGVPVEGDALTLTLPEALIFDDYSRLLDGHPFTDEDLTRLANGFLPGYTPDISREYGDWLDTYRDGTSLKLQQKLIAELLRQKLAGNWERVSLTAKACLALDPLNEEATLAMAEVMAMAGSKFEAVKLLDGYLSELGDQPAELRLPATVLRRRIAERFPEPVYSAAPHAPLLGRDSEVIELNRFLQLAKSGTPQTVLLSGEPGIGKSRLAAEFAKIAVLEGAISLTVGLQPHDCGRPMSVFVDLIPSLRRLPGALGAAPESLHLLSELASTVPVPREDTGPRAMVMANTSRALADLLGAIATEVTLVIVVEDAQWIDEMSLVTLSDLAIERTNWRLMLLLTTRNPQLLANAPAETSAHRMMLKPLTTDASTTLLQALLKNTPLAADEELGRWFQDAAAGHPLFLHALASHYLTTGVRFAVPDSLRELMEQRIERLDEQSTTVLDAVILLGKHSTIKRLYEVLGISTLDLALAIRVLDRAGFVSTLDVHMTCAHYLLGDTVVQRMPSALRILLHRQVATVLQASIPDEHDPSVAWDCAEHWYKAGEREQAISILITAADHAMTINQPQRATEFCSRACDFAEVDTIRPLARRLIDTARNASDWPNVLKGFRLWREDSVGTAVPMKHDDDELLEYNAWRITGRERAGFLDRLMACVEATEASALHRVRAARHAVALSDEILDAETAKRAYSIACALPQRPECKIDLQYLKLFYEATLGDKVIAAEIARKLMQVHARAVKAGKIPPTNAYHNSIFALYRCGYVDEAEAHLRQAVESAQPNEVSSNLSWMASTLTNLLLDRGDFEEARVYSGIAASADTRGKFRMFGAGFEGNQIRLALFDGRLADARAVLESAIRNYPILQVGRCRLMADAYRIRIRQLEGGSPSDSEGLNAILSAHRAACAFGFHDEVVAVIWHALVERGRGTEANKLLDEYLTSERRDGYAPVVEIQEILRARRATGTNQRRLGMRGLPSTS